jgi:hypothetical protein
MSADDEGTWHALWPDSHKAVGTEPERYRDKAEARQAAQRMRARQTDLQYVDIVAIETIDGQPSKPRAVDSI